MIRAKRFLNSVALLPILLAWHHAKCETISQTRMRALKRLVPLRKITVGPDDQYFAAMRNESSLLVFTHRADLVAQLRVQDLATGEVREFLPQNADSAEASFAPDGRVAFTYFRFSARGDICWSKKPVEKLAALVEEDIDCLKRGSGSASAARSNPFWRGEGEIGYLERDFGTSNSKVIVENLRTGDRKVLAKGRLWSPSMRFGGRYLVYNKLDTQGAARVLAIRDLQNAAGGERALRLALPGISGFPALSEDERYLYFSHFLNDTNADHAIDGSDNAVVFRLPLDQALKAAAAGKTAYPEQLTSVETSCSFPVPSGDSVYVTCAFEGSLDIYQMPSSGVVPAAWDEKLFQNAIDTSRSYQDRVLYLSVLKYRFAGGISPALDRKLLGDHILAGDYEAALYYVDRLAELPGADRLRDARLRVFIEAARLKSREASETVTREFRKAIERLEAKLGNATDPFAQIVRARLKDFGGDEAGAERVIKQIKFAKATSPLERVLYFELAERLARRKLPAAMEAYVETTRRQLAAPELDEQTKIHYAANFLERLENFEKSNSERIRRMEQAKAGLGGQLGLLFDSEIAVLRIIGASTDQAKFKEYGALDRLMVASKGDYFLRRALYIRAITNFADASEFKFMGFIGDNWLKYTAGDDTEFTFAREFFAVSSLDRAYDNLAAGRLEVAAGYFYQAVSITDDLEAHFGYIDVRNRLGQRKVIDERYQGLASQKLVEDNMKFVGAVLALIDHTGETSVKHLDQAIEQLNAMQTDRDSAMRFLVLGYCQLEKFLRTADGYQLDNGLFQEAHRSLMLASDLGRDNPRIRATALMNLGVLHLRAQNYGVAARFFEMRKSQGLSSDEERRRLAWLAARAYLYTHQPDRAAKELAEVPSRVRAAPIEERQAFSLAFGGDYAEAAGLYRRIFAQGLIKDGRNLATVKLAYGYSLYKDKKPGEAAAAFRESLAAARDLKAIKRGKDELIDFEPLRVRLAAAGLLARVTSGEERLNALDERWKLLEKSKEAVDDWLSLKIQNRLQVAEVESDARRRRALIGEALALVEEYGEKNQFLGNTVFRTVVAALVDSARNPALYEGKEEKRVEDLAQKSLGAIREQKSIDPVLGIQALKIQLLLIAWSRHHRGLTAAGAKAGVDAHLTSPEAQALKERLAPTAWAELQKLAIGVQSF